MKIRKTQGLCSRNERKPFRFKEKKLLMVAKVFTHDIQHSTVDVIVMGDLKKSNTTADTGTVWIECDPPSRAGARDCTANLLSSDVNTDYLYAQYM